MNNRDNLSSYDGVESLQLEQLLSGDYTYLYEKLETAESNTRFIVDRILCVGERYNICEIGSGNGKLLYRLEQEGVLEVGIGYELSESRVRLANAFGAVLNSKNVRNKAQNFLDDKNERKYDLIIMVDLVFQIVTPLYDDAEKDTLDWIKNSLNPGGKVLIEVVDYSELIKRIKIEGSLRNWQEYGQGDPFLYGLHKESIDKDGNVVIEKIHIRRGGTNHSTFKNVIKSYDKESITKLLTENGFIIDMIASVYNSKEEEEQAKQDGSYESGIRVVCRLG